MMYFALSILIMPTRFDKCKSALAAFTLTTTMVVAGLFWALFYIDKYAIANEDVMKQYPTWVMHAEVCFFYQLIGL